ncbi:PREDICTED: uncharacterized protein LOC109358036 [Lupinus angustifolius]|uniref:uncharacterized protein LOC109358036 n=1 Tax=Lupinus angustifolius TaxID=3871 RepID=UPI00092E9D13|nr:PREDICTED: uncharacterized protein LOC109358036 [Lupinus angustifolius]
MAQTTGNFATTLPILDGKNWTRWCIQMKAILGYQDVADIVEEGLPILEEGAIEAQRNAHKQNKKRDCKTICLLHQEVDNAHFEKIAGSATAKEAWDVLEKHYDGAAQLKKIHLQTMRMQFELMQMEEGEKVADFFTRLITHTNALKACGEKMIDATIVEKVLMIVSPKFDYVVVAIEESGRVENMKIEELQGSLEANEQRLHEKITDRSSHQILQMQTTKKGGFWVNNSSKSQGRYPDIKGRKNYANNSEQPEQSTRRYGCKHSKG